MGLRFLRYNLGPTTLVASGALQTIDTKSLAVLTSGWADRTQCYFSAYVFGFADQGVGVGGDPAYSTYYSVVRSMRYLTSGPAYHLSVASTNTIIHDNGTIIADVALAISGSNLITQVHTPSGGRFYGCLCMQVEV